MAVVRVFEPSFEPGAPAAAFAEAASAPAHVFAEAGDSVAGVPVQAVAVVPDPRAAASAVALAVISAVLVLASGAVAPALAGVSCPVQDPLLAAQLVVPQPAAAWEAARKGGDLSGAMGRDCLERGVQAAGSVMVSESELVACWVLALRYC